MRLFLLTALVMVAFAANSLLNRVGVAQGGLSPESFSLIRVLSGALMLSALVLWRKGALWGWPSGWGLAALCIYLVGFSRAYISLDAGLGALILFGGVQVTMFAGALIAGETIPKMRWIGMSVAMAGLVYVTGAAATGAGSSALAVAWMALAALGWGVYSLVGRGVSDPLGATARSFLFATPVIALTVLPFGVGALSGLGVVMAVLSGAITSGLGYALWYRVLPQLSPSIAAVSHLSVPVIALLGGVVFLGERASLSLMLACLVVLGGIAISLRK